MKALPAPLPATSKICTGVTSIEDYGGAEARRVAYLSAEFLLGPHLANNLLDLGITAAAREAMRGFGYDLEKIIAQEEEPGLGNEGFGRLAACDMDSLASVEVVAQRRAHHRDARRRKRRNPRGGRREVIDFIASGALGRGDAEWFRPIVENLLDRDPFLLLADDQACIDAQDRVNAPWHDPQALDAPVDPEHRTHGQILL